jgi:hypothetical protein
MTSKKVLSLALLTFVVISLVSLAVRGLRSSASAPATDPVSAGSGPVSAQAVPPPQNTVAPTAATTAIGARPTTPAPQSPTAIAASPTAIVTPAGQSPTATSGPRRVIIYYFHTTARCPTCYKIEEYTKEAVRAGFTEELKMDRLEFLTINVDAPENQHYVNDYGLYTKSVVLSEIVNGRQTRFKNLTQVWELHQDKEAFIKYLNVEISAFLAGK